MVLLSTDTKPPSGGFLFFGSDMHAHADRVMVWLVETMIIFSY